MPFGPAFTPSIALGILKSIALSRGWSADVRYHNLAFSKTIGEQFYHDVSSGLIPTHHLMGEWIFSKALNLSPLEFDCFIDEVVKPNFKDGEINVHGRRLVYDEFVESLLLAREKASIFVEECAEETCSTNPSLIGITSVFQQNTASLAFAKRCKSLLPEALIIMGGANCEGVMGKAIIEHMSFIDGVVSGEGETAFLYLLESLENGFVLSEKAGLQLQTPIDDISHQLCLDADSDSIDLDVLPTPDYHDFFSCIDELNLDCSCIPLQVPFETSRGCWWGEKHQCTFCGLNGGGMKFRSKSPGQALKELKELICTYNVKSIGVVDNILDMKYFRDFILSLTKENLDIKLFYEVKSNLKVSQLQALYSAGISHIQPGIESLSDEILGLMKKGVSALQNIKLLRDCANTGVTAEWNMLWGFPGESPAEYRNMAELIPAIYHLKPPTAASELRLDRFSPLYENWLNSGIKGVRPKPAYKHIYDLESSSIGKLAYYFDFDYLDNRQPYLYTQELMEEIKKWKTMHDESELVCVDKGEFALIFDTRFGAKEQLTILSKPENDVLQYLLTPRKIEKILSQCPAKLHEQLVDFLQELKDRKFIIELSNKLFSVVLPLDTYKPSGAGLKSIVNTIKANGHDSEGDTVINLNQHGLRKKLSSNNHFQWTSALPRSCH